MQEKETMQFQNDFVKQRAEMEKQRELEKKMTAANIMNENIREKIRTKQLLREKETKETQKILEAIKQKEQEEEQRVKEERDAKLRKIYALRESYAVQEEIRRQQKLQEKEIDRIYLSREEELALENEKNRQKYFQTLQEKQKITNERERLYQNYAKPGLKELQKKDELNQLKYISESIKKAEEEGIREKALKNQVLNCKVYEVQEKLMTKIALSNQIEYKHSVHANKKAEDKEYAERIRSHVLPLSRYPQQDQEVEERERLIQEELRRKQREYREMLQSQINEQKQRKLYNNVVMTDYERKVNANDIKAYENMAPVIHAKVVGIKAPGEVERSSPTRMWRKSTGGSSEMSMESLRTAINSNDRPYISPTPPPINYTFELAKKLNGEALYKPKGSFVTISPPKVPSKLAEIAAKNMDDPTLQIMRSNTHNSGYGYRPAINYQPPLKERSVESSWKNYNLGNQSMETRTIDNVRVPSRQKRENTSEGNRSFAYGERENPLAGAGKEFIKATPEHENLVFPNHPVEERRGSSVEPQPEKIQRRSVQKIELIKDFGKMRAAGASRRQAINYNILTGKQGLSCYLM
eukprot:TRINITY_DN120900_c2_g1_i1.p1 TRINITY_DN120900_c2_g1~~TRINITY_DN120900_c2_g1_i1.p1  ORF type:complete len:582 (+),score=100.30 TRINITY_DN120900_c2_g1_i1:754-2499(+)